MRTSLPALSLCTLLGACASAQQPSAVAPVACANTVPAWAESSASLLSSRTLAPLEERQQTRVIQAPAERDPMAELLRARGGQRRISNLALRDAPVNDTLRMFAEIGRFNVVFADGSSDRRVSLTLRDVSVATAFRSVLSVAHLDAEVVGGEVVEVRGQH